MVIDKAIERLLDSDKDISYSQRVSIVDLIESLKCCGNCDLENMWYGESECNHRDDCIKCHTGAKESFWQPIN